MKAAEQTSYAGMSSLQPHDWRRLLDRLAMLRKSDHRVERLSMFIPGGRGETEIIGDGAPRAAIQPLFLRGFECSLKRIGAADRGASAAARAWSGAGVALAGIGLAITGRAAVAIIENPTNESRRTTHPCRDVVIETSRLI